MYTPPISPLPLYVLWFSCPFNFASMYLLASIGILHALVVTVEEFSIKELDGNDGEDEVEEEVHNQDIEHILQRVDHTVKDCLQ